MYSSSYYARSAASAAWLPILSLILAIAGTVLAYIFIMPKSKVKNLNKFWYFVHNIFHFKTLLVEKIFKALYVYATIFCIISGFFMLFTNFLTGLLLMILGPVAFRISFEMIMMFIMLVQNTNDIRNKLCDGDDDTRSADAPVFEKQPPKEYVFCSSCGTRYNKLDGRCPGCGQAQTPAAPAQSMQTQAPAAPAQSMQTQAPAAPAQPYATGYDQTAGYSRYAQRPMSTYGQNSEERQNYVREHRRYQTPQG